MFVKSLCGLVAFTAPTETVLSKPFRVSGFNSLKKLILVIFFKSVRVKAVIILSFQLVARYDGACDFVNFKSVAFEKLIALPKLEYFPVESFCNWSLTVNVTDDAAPCPFGARVSPLFGA